jgi:hypothetical protein
VQKEFSTQKKSNFVPNFCNFLEYHQLGSLKQKKHDISRIVETSAGFFFFFNFLKITILIKKKRKNLEEAFFL